MSHKENHSHSHESHHHGNSGNIAVAFFLNFGFTLLEIVGGLLTNSVAILSDAVHDLGDSISLGIAWYFDRFSRRKSDEHYTYGYARFSLIGALVNGVVLISGSLFVLSEAIPRLFKPESVNPSGMIVLAIIGIMVNGAAVLRLKKGQTLNEKVVSWHLLEDVLGWVAVLISGILLYFFNIPIIDPLLSIGITLFVIVNVFKRLKEVFRIFLQGTPLDVDIPELERLILEVSGIKAIHHTHVWTIDGIRHLFSSHIVIEMNFEWAQIKQIKQSVIQLLEDHDIHHVTLEIETVDDQCDDPDCEIAE